MKPLVSILIPAYNAEAFLPATLESVLLQTWPRIEVIVVDNGSTDGTLDVARSYEDRGVTVVAQNNAGASAARNTAFRHSTGDFIQFLDADDILHPRKIEVQVRRLLSEAPGSCALSSWARFYDNDPATADFVPKDDWKDYETPIEWLIDVWTWRGTMPPGSWLCPRDVIEAAGPWNEAVSLNDDMDFFARVALTAERLVFCGDSKWYYRTGNPSLSARRDERALRSQFEVARLCTENILAVEDSRRVRHACACHWQSFQFLAYPDVPELVAEAGRRIAALGGGTLKPDLSPKIAPVRDLLGWKAALRLQRMVMRIREVAA